MASDLKLGMIGLDTSHSIEFARLLQGDAPAEQRVAGMRVMSCLRFPSPFQAEDGQDKRQAQLETWGVKVTRSLDDVVKGVDALLIEINDPDQHWKYFEPVAGLGLPIFLDKPFAGTVEDGRKILGLARAKGTKVWSSSSLRFMDRLQAARREVPDAVLGHAYGPLGKAPSGSSLVWYGVHTVEMLVAALGTGAARVRAVRDSHGMVIVVQYADGRRGVAECNEGTWFYGGRLQSQKELRVFEPKPNESFYATLVAAVRDGFLSGQVPVPLATAHEILAILVAADRSAASGAEEPVVL